VLTTDSLTGLAALTAIVILAGVIWTRARSTNASRHSASGLLTTIRGLQSRNARGGEIILPTNPSRDLGIHILLTNLRGFHQFAAHVALYAVEDGCERIISTNPRADASDALKESLRRVGLVTKAGN